MATHVVIDDKLIEKARTIGKHTTIKAAATEALEEYIRKRRQPKIIGLFGTIEFDDDFDFKKQRKRV